MKPRRAMCPENYDEMMDHLEEVYGNAYWALRNGAHREHLITQIDLAIEMLQEELASGEPLFDGYPMK